jgi:eukaryotic-like serine/threonine-protein kinase
VNAPTLQPTIADRTDQLADLLERVNARVMAGEEIDFADLIREHPELAGELRDLLPTVRGMAELARASVPHVEAGGVLGGFRIIREVGRGGMGVVYEAEQLGRRRRVALKILNAAAALDERQRQRFTHEPHAAALLNHPNIVPVLEIGCDRGVHFYAMEYIEGQSLAAAISECEAGPNRAEWAVRLGVQAARALDYAHQQGLIHRDIKPGNLLIDHAGRLWITDFGLAKLESLVGEGGDLTMTGDLVGTLRYMAPEQALGRRGLVDHRCDIYSLGATLYEALAGRPAFVESERDALLRLIGDGRFDPLSRHVPSIHRDLETIVLKAMEREPSHRYLTAAEVADDIQRFLDGKPILAKRRSSVDHALDWAGRHRRMVAVSIGSIVFTAAASIAVSAVIWRERNEKAHALEQARLQSQRAEAHFVEALDGATRFLTRLEEPKWSALPGIADLRNDGLKFFGQFIHAESADPKVRFESSRACRRMASVYCAEQDAVHAQEALRLEFTLLDRLVADAPNEPAYREELADAHVHLGTLHISLHEPDAARKEFSQAGDHLHSLAEQNPSAERLNRYAWFLADCPDHGLRNPKQAAALAQRAIDQDATNGNFWNSLGVAQFRVGQLAAAKQALSKSMELRQGGDPYDWFFLAMIAQRDGERADARQWYDRSVAWMTAHQPLSQDVIRYRAEADSVLGKKLSPLSP